jgi:L-ascorbate metabolism protein UlaG (beta-lactamase superfamily)
MIFVLRKYQIKKLTTFPYKRTLRRIKKIAIIAGVPFCAFALVFTLSTCTSFGRLPEGERLERIERSPNYRDGQFQNKTPVPIEEDAPKKSKLASLISFAFRDTENLAPETDLPSVKTDLHNLDRNQDILVWLGHSSLFLQIDGIRFLFDPVLIQAAPFSPFNKPFKGTDIFKPEDIPDIDYLVITHDHWDHLDYDTVKELQGRTKEIICGLGVGEHFEYWGFDTNHIVELDWTETAFLQEGFVIQCFPARHFSGRGLSGNKSLWVSYMLHTPTMNIYISGDSGYDTHFAEIGRTENIDLAIVENGQYNEDWKYIHLMPDDLVQAVKDLGAARFFTVHNSKYALSMHSWDEPLINISRAAERDNLNLITPMIGEPVFLKDAAQVFRKWWE